MYIRIESDNKEQVIASNIVLLVAFFSVVEWVNSPSFGIQLGPCGDSQPPAGQRGQHGGC